MTSARFSLKNVFFVVTYAGIAVAAVKHASEPMGDVGRYASYGLIPAAFCLAAFGARISRKFWIGYFIASTLFVLTFAALRLNTLDSLQLENHVVGRHFVALHRMIARGEIVSRKKAVSLGIFDPSSVPFPLTDERQNSSELPANWEEGIPIAIDEDGNVYRVPRGERGWLSTTITGDGELVRNEFVVENGQVRIPLIVAGPFPRLFDFVRVAVAIGSTLAGIISGILFGLIASRFQVRLRMPALNQTSTA